jgi:MoaA/NifB/PqqE/SkfB family radical SAM enzyme
MMCALDYQAQVARYLKDFRLSIQQSTPLVNPLRATFPIITRCNSRCNYCGVWEAEPYEVPLADCKLVIDELYSLGVQAVTLTGGEPLLHNGLAEIVAYARERGLVVSVTTNGLLLNSNRLWPLLEAGLHVLTLSLDTVDPSTYAAIRGVPLEPIFDGLNRLLKARANFPNMAVSVNCIISKANIKGIVPLVEYCSKRDISVGFQPVHFTYGSGHKPGSPYEQVTMFGSYQSAFLVCTAQDLPQLHNLIEQLLVMQEKGYLINSDPEYLKGFPEFLVYKRLPRGFMCTTGFTTVSIDHMLNVRSCWPMAPIGNLRTQRLMEIWHSEEYNRYRAVMLSLKCPKCWLRCHTEWSERWLQGFLNWLAIRRGSQC